MEKTVNRMCFRKVILATTIAASLILMAGLALAWYVREDSISQTPSLVSAYADVAASGPEIGPEYVAVVWSEDATNHWGALKLRWGPPGEPWMWPIKTVDGGSEAREPAVAVYSDTAHIAYIKQGDGGSWVVSYAKCQGSSCQNSDVYASITKLGSVDIALCGMIPHIVWAEVETASDDIWFSAWAGSQWDPDQVESSGDNSSPSIACDVDDIVHIAWIKDDQDVMYTNSLGWTAKKTTIWYGGEPYNTSIAVYGGYVDVVFDYKDGTKYSVGERRRYPDETWCNNGNVADQYISTHTGTEYIRYLRPAVAVYSDTTKSQPVPVVVWHAQMVDAYEVMHSYGTSFAGTCPSVLSWSTPISLAVDLSKQDCSAPSVAMGMSGTTTHTHVVFQERIPAEEPSDPDPWEIHYTSNISNTLTQAEPDHNNAYLPIIMKNY